MTSPLWQKTKRTKEPLNEGERGERKSWLKTQHSKNEDHSIQSHHFMANRWGKNGNSNRLFLGALNSLLIVTAAMKLKALAPWKKAMSNTDSILKSRDISLLAKFCLVKAMVFPVVKYGCESWTIKKAEHQRIDAFELWCWRRLL